MALLKILDANFICTWLPGLRGVRSLSDLLSAGSNVAWSLFSCILWVWVAHNKRDVSQPFLVTVLVTGWFLPVGFSCSPGGQVAYQRLFFQRHFLSAVLFWPHHWPSEWGGSKSYGQCHSQCRILQNPYKQTADTHHFVFLQVCHVCWIGYFFDCFSFQGL